MAQKQTLQCNSFHGWLTSGDITYSTDLVAMTLVHCLIQASVFGGMQRNTTSRRGKNIECDRILGLPASGIM